MANVKEEVKNEAKIAEAADEVVKQSEMTMKATEALAAMDGRNGRSGGRRSGNCYPPNLCGTAQVHQQVGRQAILGVHSPSRCSYIEHKTFFLYQL